MQDRIFLAVLATWGAGFGLQASAQSEPAAAAIEAAIADPSRPDSERQRDALRKPAEVIAFAGVKPGDQVGELLPGRGYFTHIFCKLVGERGHVYTLTLAPVMPMGRPPEAMRPPAIEPAAPASQPCANVTVAEQPAAKARLPGGLDVVWTSEDYHDLHNKMFGTPDMKRLNRMIYRALKPGGVYVIEDHTAEAGSGARDTETLHRIDPQLVKREVLGAGFVLEASSDVLHNPDDAHTAKVFELGGHSDKFLVRFRKPGHKR